MKTTQLSKVHRAKRQAGKWFVRRDLSLLAGVAGLLGIAGVSILLALALTACGGGGSSVASVGSGGTGTVGVYNVGTITGFGSVFVNGVRFDDTGASVSDEDGARSRDDLRLGMVVKVQGSVNSTGSATASSFMFDSELQGPVRSISATGNSLNIIGQTVSVNANTVFDASLPQGASSLQVGQVLEVHGFLNPSTNTLQASLVELKTNPNRYKISGLVNQWQSGSKTFQIGTETISYNGLNAADIAPGLADGQLVKVRLVPSAPPASGSWQAARLRGSDDTPRDNEKTEVEGLVSAITSATQFTVGTIRVDARSASFSGDTAGLAVGARVEVKGALVAGTLVASQVKLQQNASSKEIDLKGTISALNLANKTFVLRGVPVNYAAVSRYDNGSESTLANGIEVQVKGQTSPSSATIHANRISFDK